MQTVKKIASKKHHDNVSVSETAIDYQNDPFVLRKLADAREMLNRAGMREQLKKLAESYEKKA